MAKNQNITGLGVGGNFSANDVNFVQTINNTIKDDAPLPKKLRFKVEKPSPNFTGRTEFLKELDTIVKKGQGRGDGAVTDPAQKNAIIVVAATGGIGKTSTVRKYVQEHDLEYEHIVWIDAEKFSFAEGQFKELALRLQIPTDFDKKEKPLDQILTEIFERLVGNVLLVLDNAEAFDDDSDRNLSGIRRLLPPPSSLYPEPTIIVTSRNLDWSVDGEVSESVITIPLGLWSDDEVALYVAGQLPLQKDAEALQQLGTRFGHLPIAIKSAVAVIRQQNKRDRNNKYGILDLLKEYHKSDSKTRKTVLQQKHLTASVVPDETSNKITMLVLWNISLEKIVKFEDGELAIKILCFMSYMSPTRIPQSFLFALFKNSPTENALEILEDYTLIASLSSDDDFNSRSFSIHRMIQDSTIENLRTRKTNQEQTPHPIFKETTFLNEDEVLLKLSDESVPYLDTLTQPTLLRSGELVETLIQLTNHVSEKLDVEKFRNLTEVTAKVLKMTNNFSKSIELFKRALEGTPCRIENLEKITQLKYELAYAYGEGGHFQESSDLYLQVHDALKPFIGSDHKGTLNIKKRAAYGLYFAGKVDDAMEMFREVLQGYENNGDTQSKDYLNAMFFSGERGREELLTQMLKEGENNPDYDQGHKTVAKLNTARQLINEGKLGEASKVMLQTIKDATELLGPFHLLTLSCRRYYASRLHDQGKDDEAAPLLLELLETEKTQLGPDHRCTLETKCALGGVYFARKELDQAEALLDVQIWERVFGLNDPLTLETATILSKVKVAQGKFGEALALQKKVLKIQKNVLVPNHKDTLCTMHNIAISHFKMGEFEKAAEAVQELLMRQRKALGENHPDSVRTLKILFVVMKHLHDRADLICCFMARTSVDVKTGKSFLKASHWDLEAALDTYRNSNPNSLIADEDSASTPGLGTSTVTQIENNLIVEFVAVAEVDTEVGKLFLHASGWCKEIALGAFYNSRFYKETAALNLQGQALIPLDEVATDAGNQNVAAASCNKRVANEIQDCADPGVQVESVPKPKRTTTSISFSCPGGARLRGEFGVSSTVKDLYAFVNEKRPDLADSNYVLTMYPNTKLTKMEETMEEANLLNNAALTLKMQKK